jgi:hypothetical protein
MSIQYDDAFVPKNHEGVFYLFARNHERLGFEKIVRIIQGDSPDIEAIRNGKRINIELEYKSSTALEHYRVLYKDEQEKYERAYKGTWKREGNIWNYVDKQNGQLLFSKKDEGYHFDESRGVLLYNTAKSAGIDIFIYWIKAEDFKFWEFDKEVELVDLRKELISKSLG